MRPTRKELFLAFFWVGIIGFGGVLPLLRRMVVERRGWLDAAEFTDVLAICQLLPGPNVTNFAVYFGTRYGGVTGAAAAVSGLIAAPFAIVVLLGTFIGRLDGEPLVGRAMGGMAAAGAGLVLGTAMKIGQPLFRRVGPERTLGLAVAGLSCAALAAGHLSLPWVLGVAAPLSVALHARLEPR